jgi:flavodoxin
MKTLICLYSYHHNNTEKIANAIAKVVKAEIQTPKTLKPEQTVQYNLIGFGAWIDRRKHYNTFGIALMK